MKKHVLKKSTQESCRNKGIFDLVAENFTGEVAILSVENDTEVKYSMSCQKVMFNGADAMLFLIRKPTNIEKMSRKLMEDKYRSVLLSTITHDIRTPLTIIKGNMEMLKDQVQAKGELFLEAIMVSITALEYFINDITVSRRRIGMIRMLRIWWKTILR